MKQLLILVFLFNSWLSIAQNTQTYTHESAVFRTAIELYDKEKYGAARQYFEKYLALGKNDLLSIEAQYYAADCGLQLFHSDAEPQLNQFVKTYPVHPKAQQALLSLGNIYKSKKDYKKALFYYLQVNDALLSKDDANEAMFQTGYCYLNDKQSDKALPYFNGLKVHENKYTYASCYYAGNIEYRQGNFEAAIADLNKAKLNDAYRPLVPYIMTNILYRQKKYDELITYTDTLGKGKKDYKNTEEIQLITADVYFRKQEYLKCINATERYKGAGKELPDDAQFRYAKSFYYLGRNPKAIDNFKKLADHKDSIGQHASYFLALTYFRDDNKAFALPLLSQASQLNYSPDLKEEALFLYSKVSYELGKFGEVITSLKDYRKKYPKGRFIQEVSELLSDVLLNTNNYAEALEYIESLPKRTPRIDAVYQKVAYQRAEELYNQGLKDSAVVYFEKSQEFPSDKKLEASASYWIGEVLSGKQEYKEAQDHYLNAQETKQFAGEDFYKKADYGLGYAFYNQKMYDKAATRFRQYTGNRDQATSKYFPDALLRLGDCYYALKRFNESLTEYEKAVQANNKETDYILLQKGLINGSLGNYEQADNFLFALTHNYPKSPYYETALFNKALFGLERGDYQTAVQSFTMFIRERPTSSYVPYALERRAISNVNLKRPELAYTDYQQVLKDYPASPVANAALEGIQEIMSKEGKNDEFVTILEEFKTANPQKSDLENIEFESGKRLYFDQKYKEAVRALTSFSTTHPQSALVYDATYYLADSYYRLGSFDEALSAFQKVIEVNKGSFGNRAIFKVAEIHFTKANYPAAIAAYKQLQSVASSKKEVVNACQGMMLAYYQQAQYDSSFSYAQTIASSGYATVSGYNKAILFRAKSVLAQKDTLKAIDYLLVTMNEAQDENGAEAQYLTASLFYAQKRFKSSLNELFNLNDYFSEHTSWVGKSFLLIADNYLALNELFQAKATLQSLAKNFPEEAVVNAAKNKLEEIKGLEKNSN